MIVVGKQINSFTQSPGLDLQNLQPGWMHLLADSPRNGDEGASAIVKP